MAPTKKLVLLDSMALIYRAYFALYKQRRVNRKGVETGAVFGFVNTLVDLLTKEDPTHVIALFDSTAPTFRHAIYDAYKAHRQAQPEGISTGLPYIRSVLNAFGIPAISLEGYEADDLMGTLTRQAVACGYDVCLVSPDKDLCQLVSGKVRLYKPGNGKEPTRVWSEEEVKKEWGVEAPHQVADVLGLWGDPSDNIPGAPGVGEKRAKELIGSYGSIEGVFSHLDGLSTGLRRTFTDYRDQILLSKKLATIKVDAPLLFAPESAVYKGPNLEVLAPILEELELHSLQKRLLPSPPASQGQASLGTPLAAPSSYNPSRVRYHCLTTLSEAEALVERLRHGPAFCFDTETTGLNALQASLLGLSFSSQKGEASYLALPADATKRAAFLRLLQPLFSNERLCKVGHNLKYDLTVLLQHGIEVAGPLFDTMVAHHLLEPDNRHGLNFLAKKYFDYEPIRIESLIGEKGPGQRSMGQLPLESITPYACEDSDFTWRLYETFVPLLKEGQLEKLFYTVEMPLIPVLVEMERAGVAVDKDVLSAIHHKLSKVLADLTEKIHALSGAPFNLDSPKQLGVVLFEQLRIVERPTKTPSGQYATNESVLSKLRSRHPIVGQVLTYRALKKLQSTYVNALPALINPADGRIHTSFQQSVVATGRLSSTDPNLQNIPIRTEEGREVRKAFVAQEGYLLFSADYSQIELRLMAHFSKDEGLCAAFRAQKDVHTITAAQIFQVEEEAVTPEMRRQAKMVNFGIIYGISPFGLAERLSISKADAAAIIDAYFRKFPGVKRYMEHTISLARERGYATTLLGRKRFLPDINSRNATIRGFAERNAINMPIQGSQAELTKKAMISVFEWLKKSRLRSRLILQVHDELLLEACEAEVAQLQARVPTLMKEALPLSVPVEVNCGVGANWLEAH